MSCQSRATSVPDVIIEPVVEDNFERTVRFLRFRDERISYDVGTARCQPACPAPDT